MEAEDVPDLYQAPGRAAGGLQLARLRRRRGERLFDEAMPAGRQALAGDRAVAARRRDDVHRVDVGERLAIVGDRTSPVDALSQRPGQTVRGCVGDPHRRAELGQHAQVVFAPAAEADQQDVHGSQSWTSSPPTSSMTS